MNKFFLATLIGIMITGGHAMADTEKPAYTIIDKQGDIETRSYPPLIVAQTTVKGERDKAINDAFRILADYIFGNNISKKKIAMTAPVVQQESEKIAMTAPVLQQSTDNKSWNVQFIMPSSYTMETLPKPVNDAVVLKNVPSKKQIAIRFTGFGTQSNLAKHKKELENYIATHKLETDGPAIYAFYNPPWTLPFLRRNEILYDLK